MPGLKEVNQIVCPLTVPVVSATCCVVDETKGERAAQSIRQKCADYLDRAEQLKEYLKKKENCPPAKPVKESDDKG